MRPLTYEKPKPLLSVLGKPLMQHIFEILPDDIHEVIMVVGYKSEMIKSFMGNTYLGKRIVFVEQKEPWGTAHALFLCKKHLENEKKFLLMYADDLHSKKGVQDLLKYDSALMVSEVENPERFGVVTTRSDNSVLDIEEKPKNPKSNLVATGVYVLRPEIFSYYEKEREGKGEYFLTEMIAKYIQDFECKAVRSDFWIPIGYPADLEKAEKVLRDRIKNS